MSEDLFFEYPIIRTFSFSFGDPVIRIRVCILRFDDFDLTNFLSLRICMVGEEICARFIIG